MNNKKKQIIDWIIKICLVIIIIFLLLHNCDLERKNKEQKPTTGNVQIIEIKCDKDDICEVVPKDDDNGKTKPTNKDDSGNVPVENGGKLVVVDHDITWNGQVDAKIFTNSMYMIEDVIAPESHNTYQFIVKNGTEYKLKYNINFTESNPYHINMKYKLKKNDNYLIDHYVSASELNITNMLLNTGENDTYYLEWKWVSSSNDTEIGKTPNANYGLKIEVKAESTNG